MHVRSLKRMEEVAIAADRSMSLPLTLKTRKGYFDGQDVSLRGGMVVFLGGTSRGGCMPSAGMLGWPLQGHQDHQDHHL